MQKQELIKVCHDYFKNKINSLTLIISEVTESSNSESKSSAGDKHETAKAMMQLEREKLGTQLKEAEEQLSEFERINFNKLFQKVEQGSVVETDKGSFFIGGSIGKIKVGDELLFVISGKSPLARALEGKTVKDVIDFNGITYKIKKIS
ncbi:MAG: 3-oxoacyl-ACP synthase [Burkholderiales bacterium]|nr:3-oxoacyl-ACP synthase [Bacteroidia bacterium]